MNDKIDMKTTITICLLMVGLVAADTLVNGNEINEDTQIKHTEIFNGMANMTADDVYNMKEEYFNYVPLRASIINHNGMDIHLLQDGYGNIYVSTEELFDGANYIGRFDNNTSELLSIEEGYFDFSEVYENNFETYEDMSQDRLNSIIGYTFMEL